MIGVGPSVIIRTGVLNPLSEWNTGHVCELQFHSSSVEQMEIDEYSALLSLAAP